MQYCPAYHARVMQTNCLATIASAIDRSHLLLCESTTSSHASCFVLTIFPFRPDRGTATPSVNQQWQLGHYGLTLQLSPDLTPGCFFCSATRPARLGIVVIYYFFHESCCNGKLTAMLLMWLMLPCLLLQWQHQG